jgi:hypothetical protein
MLPRWFRVTLLALTIAGGLHGIVITIADLFSPDVRGFGVIVVLGFVGAYIYVAVAGVVFWRYPQQRRPLFWALGIQVPWISLPGLVYKFAVGLSGSLVLDLNHTGDKYAAGFKTSWNLGSSFQFWLLQDAPVEVGINVAAVAALFLLRRLSSSTTNPLEDPAHKRDDQVYSP